MKENLQICDDCKSLELEKLNNCVRCGQKYCPHNSSDVNVSYCFHCLQVEMKVVKETREVKRVDPRTGNVVIISVETGVTDFVFEGNDWLYCVQKIKDFSTDPLGDWKFTKMAEYYKKLGAEMIRYREDVRQAKLDDLRSKGLDVGKVKIPGVNGEAKILSSTIQSPEAIARKKAVDIAKTMGQQPTPQIIDGIMRAMGFGK